EGIDSERSLQATRLDAAAMTYRADELVKNVVGAFLRRHSGHFFCIGCLSRQVNTELGPSFSSAEIHRVVDAMFRSTQNKSGPFACVPSVRERRSVTKMAQKGASSRRTVRSKLLIVSVRNWSSTDGN